MAVRVYELSKQLNIPNKKLLKILQEQGFDLSSHIAVVPSEAVARIKEVTAQKDKQTLKANAETESIKPKAVTYSRSKKALKQQNKVKNNMIVDNKNNKIIIAPMTVADFAVKAKKPVTEIIVALLKKGIVAAKNNVISEKQVEDLAKLYDLEIDEALKKETKESDVSKEVESIDEGVWKDRLPIVVVIGHVDHGKTTLLDFIRKTRVTAKEKGGITQHLGAYEVKTDQGGIVFLDTPGHEAFSIMRVRGIKVADIAILVVAADDGVMPQTVEAIKRAQEVGLPLIVAINKIDKATAAQLENVKSGLAQYGLLPEEWGGEVVCIPISAKEGTGISDLLEVIILQSQLMELKSNISIPARGYVLESKLERGLGPVATIICLHGKLHIKDYFVCGKTSGRVNSMINSDGKRVHSVAPSIPVQVSGFSELVQAGDAFQVVSKQEARKGISITRPAAVLSSATQIGNEKNINIIVKADNASSREAVVDAIKKLSKEQEVGFNLVYSSVGNITESDVVLASDTGSVIYAFSVKSDINVKNAAQKADVEVKYYDIIYKLLEALQELAESKKEIKYITQKVGEVNVLKVFDIKNLGVIAGGQVKSGKITKDCYLKIWRGKNKIGEGPLQSLQKDRKVVKEVVAGFECAFMIDGFGDWQVDDRVECYLDIPEN